MECFCNHIIYVFVAKSKKRPVVEERIGSPILSSEEESPKLSTESLNKDAKKVKNDGNSKSLEIPIDRIYSDSDEEREYQVFFILFCIILINNYTKIFSCF